MLRFAIERGTILSVAVLIFCLFGIIAIMKVPVQMIPDMETTVISVYTSWPGATPQDVEKELLIEQEQYLRKIPNLKKMTAEARTGRASIELEFNLGTDIQEALLRVNNALSQVSAYPENVDQPRLVTSSSSQNPFIFYAVRQREGARLETPLPMMLDFLSDEVGTRLERVPGVSEAPFHGGVSRQIQLRIDPLKLSERHISISQLRQAIRARNRDMSGGDIDSGKRRYLIRTIGRYESISDIENTVIAERNGAQIKIRDVGTVELHHEEVRGKNYINGEPTFIITLKREVGANVIDVLDGVKAEVEILNNTILKDHGLRMEWVADDVGYVKDAISVVQKNLAAGGLLACLILFLFLHSVKPTLLGALGVPVCTIGAFLGLLLTGRTLNVISLAGIAFAIGMTLDNSIVVLENIFRHRSMGKSHYQAALDAVKEVWRAVLASTLTTVFVFLPVILIEEEAGQLYSDIAIAISSAIILSMLFAVSVIPSAASRLPDSDDPDQHPGGRWFKPFLAIGQHFQALTLGFVHWLLASTRRSLLFVCSLLLLSLLIVLTLTPRAEYLPEGEESKLFAFMLPPAGYNINEMDTAATAIEKSLIPHIDVSSAAFERGDTPVPPIDYFIRFSGDSRTFMVASPVNPGPEHVEALQKVLSEKFGAVPGMIAFANRGSIFSGNTGGSRSIEMEIQGPDLATVYQSAMNAFLRSKTVLEGAQIRPVPGLSLSQPTIEIHPDWDRTAELGISASDLGYLVWSLSDGAYLDEFFLDDDKIDLYLYSTSDTVSEPADLEKLPVYSSGGSSVPLGAIASIRETVNADTIRRVDGNRTVTLAIVPPLSIALEEAVELVEQQVIAQMKQQGDIPQSVSIHIAGASDKLRATRKALSGNFLISVLLSYLLMVAIFSHWGFPLLILFAIPLGISGGIGGLWFMNHVLGINMPFDMITMLGMVVLIGIVVNNPILLVEETRRNLHKGIDRMPAIIDATQTRLRPIMMSMLTTIFGLSPVVFLPGAGTELYRGLGTIVLFGLFFSTIITLTFMPALLSLILQLSSAFQRRRQAVKN
jgi:multidrug efflux pump subunit AcrB